MHRSFNTANWIHILSSIPSCNTVKMVVRGKRGLPGWLSGKESTCQCRRHSFRSLDQEDSLEEEMATHSGILAWEMSWTEEHGRLQFMGLQRVGHNSPYRITTTTNDMVSVLFEAMLWQLWCRIITLYHSMWKTTMVVKFFQCKATRQCR